MRCLQMNFLFFMEARSIAQTKLLVFCCAFLVTVDCRFCYPLLPFCTHMLFQASQAYLMGNKALAKQLSMKGQLHNMQMKAAHNKAQESIYRQRFVVIMHSLP